MHARFSTFFNRLLPHIAQGLIAFWLICVIPMPAFALSTIRDAELESVLRRIANPIFQSAGLPPDNIHLFIINDPQINAFVTGGMNLFIYTGLLTEFEDPQVILSVIAHETGHIAGGHLARGSERFRGITIGTTLSYLLGAAAAVSGAPAGGMAIIQGGQHIAQREALQYSRENEESADQAGLSFLEKTHNSPAGLLTLLEFLSRRERMLYGTLDPYAQTHPLSRERILHVQSYLSTAPYKNALLPADIRAAYKRVNIKLRAFLNPPAGTLKRYSASDNSTNARYARAIALYRQPDIKAALATVDGLITDFPDDPYFHELKGQILFENGRSEEAVIAYRKAITLSPSPLLKLALAQAEIAASDNTDAKSAGSLLADGISKLHQALTQEPDNIAMYEQLALAHGKRGETGLSYLARAEQSMLRKDSETALRYARIAQKSLPAGSPSFIRTRDIIESAKNLPKKDSDHP